MPRKKADHESNRPPGSEVSAPEPESADTEHTPDPIIAQKSETEPVSYGSVLSMCPNSEPGLCSVQDTYRVSGFQTSIEEHKSDPPTAQKSETEPYKRGSGSIRAAVLRIGSLPVSDARAAEVREQLGLQPEAGITHYDSLAAAGWAKAEDSASKDWAIFLRDTGGENPSKLAKTAGGTGSEDGPLPSAEDLREEDLKQYSDEVLRALLKQLEGGSTDD